MASFVYYKILGEFPRVENEFFFLFLSLTYFFAFECIVTSSFIIGHLPDLLVFKYHLSQNPFAVLRICQQKAAWQNFLFLISNCSFLVLFLSEVALWLGDPRVLPLYLTRFSLSYWFDWWKSQELSKADSTFVNLRQLLYEHSFSQSSQLRVASWSCLIYSSAESKCSSEGESCWGALPVKASAALSFVCLVRMRVKVKIFLGPILLDYFLPKSFFSLAFQLSVILYLLLHNSKNHPSLSKLYTL